jgi:putative ABC transport system ATP-binding protein
MSDDHARWRPPGQRGETAARTPEPATPVIEHTEPERAFDSYRWQDRVSQAATLLEPIVTAQGISRDYPMGDGVVHALKPIDLDVIRGQLVAVHGRSGSGKTTMLNLIGGLDRPSAGRVWIDGVEVTAMPESELVNLRRHKIGFIFQAFGLLPILTATENVEVPLRLAKVDVDEREERVRVLLELVGLGERAKHRPYELSGGEQQRVAIARALANGPRLLLADEPTGQLDSRTAQSIMTLMRALVKSEGLTAIVATHDPILIDLADRVVELRDGQILSDHVRRR